MKCLVQNTIEAPEVQFIDRVVDIPVVQQRQRQITTVEIPRMQFLDSRRHFGRCGTSGSDGPEGAEYVEVPKIHPVH